MELPLQFVQSMRDCLGEEAESLFEAIGTDPQVSVRINDRKLQDKQLPCLVPWSGGLGFYVDQRPVFTLDPLFHAGAYYVQEASSMFVGHAFKALVKEKEPVVLDLCASPGGKSTHLATMLGGHGLLVSNEVVRQRVAPLRENITKWGSGNTVVTNSEASAFGDMGAVFDLIVVDAPCSGEGMFRKDPQAVTEWSEANVENCVTRQREILKDIYAALKPGGLLFYSTCTYNPKEDEEQVDFVCKELGAEIEEVPVEGSWNITSSGLGYHFYPHKTRGEGFFFCALRKTSGAEEMKTRLRGKAQDKRKTTAVPGEVHRWVKNSEKYTFWLHGDMVLALPSLFYDFYARLQMSVKVVQAGTAVATVKGKNVLPAADLALMADLNQEAFTAVELEWCEALKFLRKESLAFSGQPNGWLLVKYGNVPLGWVKNVGNRANNAYPNEWRVRMQANEADYVPLF